MSRIVGSDETIHTWELYPHMIQWHQHHRQFVSKSSPGSPRLHINAMLVLCSAMMVEGAVSSLLLFYLEGPFSPFSEGVKHGDPVSSFHERNRQELQKRVRKGTWNSYKDLFSTISGESLPEILSPEWSRLEHLFQFRNLLAHGETIRVKGTWKPSEGLSLGDMERNKASLFGYLEKEGFINKPKFGEPMGWSFLDDDVADHFIKTAWGAVEKLASGTPDTDHEDTLPKRLKEVLMMTETPDPTDCKLLYSFDNKA